MFKKLSQHVDVPVRSDVDGASLSSSQKLMPIKLSAEFADLSVTISLCKGL